MCNPCKNINNLTQLTRQSSDAVQFAVPTIGGKIADFSLDKTETPAQKNTKKNTEKGGSNSDKQSFLNTYYKNHNNFLAQGLRSTQYIFNPTISKIVKRLNFCSHLCKVEQFDNPQDKDRHRTEILATSKKCRDKNCPRCNSIKASKYKKRFLRCLSDEKMSCFFRNKYFYFLTFTVKHNLEDTRNYVYFDEFKGYVEQLRRSKLFDLYFPLQHKFPRMEEQKDKFGRGANTETLIKHGYWKNPTKEPVRNFEHKPFSPSKYKGFEAPPSEQKNKSYISGYAQSYEVTFTKNGYHIHSHVLMCAPKLKEKVNEVQKKIQNKWQEITGDSTQVRLDLVKVDADFKAQIEAGHVPQKLSGFISECFKYTVKAGNVFGKENTNYTGIEGVNNKFDLIAKWLISTKGKKMITANGFFKDLSLFANKSVWDLDPELSEEEQEERENLKKHNPTCRYFVGRTSDIKYNHSPTKTYSKKEKKKVLSDIHITKLGSSFLDITYIGREFDDILNQIISPENEQIYLNIDAFDGVLTEDGINRLTYEKKCFPCDAKPFDIVLYSG